jgi:prepilin-type N-terminal cleavage/methylation domain-containing protein
MRQTTTKCHQAAGFTLVEIIFVLAIFGLVSVALMSFFIFTARGIVWATNKAEIVGDVRNFTARITDEALDANVGYVYKSFALAQRDAPSDRVESGLSGDCLVLVHTERYPTMEDPDHYSKIVVFFRLADEDGVGPVHRAEVEFSPPLEPGGLNFETFMANHFPDDPTDFPVVLQLSRGLTDGSLFQNRRDISFLVNGEIIHGKNREEVTNTYNLTISPRG